GALLDGRATAIVAPAAACMDTTLPPETLKKRTFPLRAGGEYDRDSVVSALLGGGYTRVDTVEGVGQFAVRGDIIDFYPPSDSPLRLDFFDRALESVNRFDVYTQRRGEKLGACEITPCAECAPDDAAAFETALASLAKRDEGAAADLERLRAFGRLPSSDKYQKLIMPDAATLADYCADALVFIAEPHACAERARESASVWREEQTALIESGSIAGGENGLRLKYSEFVSVYGARASFLLEDLRRGSGEFKRDFEERIPVRTTGAWQGGLAQLDELLASYKRKGSSVLLFAGSEKNAEYIAGYLRENGFNARFLHEPESVDPGVVTVTDGFFSSGVEYESENAAIVTCGELPYVRKKRAKLHKKGAAINSLADLHEGDYVVHSYYGIGLYEGVEQLTFEGVTKEYIKIKYAGTDSLFVPVNQLDLVSKYIGCRGEGAVQLSKMGGAAWKNATKRAKAAAKDLAKELIKLYAERTSRPGHAFSPDGEWQKEFEAAFPFEETDDQLRCAEEVKADMESTVPMDRILCGDVGYGKTEVALRAVFKCIADGMQAAILVPTTLLALQHYNTAVRRFERMPVEIEFLSRFKTKKEQNDIVKRLADGRCDLVIGTHRILSKDIRFKNLGLLVIDEEQRFGVASKEKLRQLCKGVDTLMLSATPIPRTLNMALSGIRDLSMLEEPPVDRQPVMTFVAEYSPKLVYGAIERELSRGGQVYYLYNRVEGIERVAARIAERFPDAAVAVAHGQMDEDELSDIWSAVVDGEIQILVCTTIIETGIDVPNVNTLIVENADMMGLSQLHQLRGRVGRSARRAYAYFTFRKDKAISEVSEKRLAALREFTEFGSGIRIAMRDLEIRGAGNLIGSQQSGHMDAVGYDLYMKLLADAVRAEKGEAPEIRDADCFVNLPVSAFIPESYVASELTRIELYRDVAAVASREDADAVLSELRDRFGEPPKCVSDLVGIALLRSEGNRLKLDEISYRQGGLCVIPTEPDERVLGRAALIIGSAASVKIGAKPYLYIKNVDKRQTLSIIEEVLDKYRMAQYVPNEPSDGENASGSPA
ncbi:MAG: transcription-repair coupling factor, partial [Clostridia bacterium]|nr:transcription-repair coupling factor [Clostridia bacterium]